MGLLTGLAIASTAIAGATAVDGMVKSKKAEKALANLTVPELENPNRDISVSTVGSDLMKEEGQRQSANILGSLQYSDASNMFTALPRLASMNNQINQQASLQIDNQMQRREYAIAGYEERLNQVEENRYQGEVAGLGAMYNNGQQQMWNGIKGTISGAGSIGRAMDGGTDVGLRPEAKTASTLKPIGVSGNYAYAKTNLNQVGVQDFSFNNEFPTINF